MEVLRPEKFGGDVHFHSYEDLEKAFVSGKLHPMDLKNSVTEYLENIIAPIRKRYR